ncbi:ATP-grasp domain protein [Bacteriovorax sp. BSW11_IV]|uniref:ATP-grasp domain-containing protein n=1 Tax=Bacteriovorax sp. BSW11_IV TaxID=1353529 RepID=UPI00038A0307|nr:ATP-grasp domain-containing protein [Bacteriovorax sp. BSW11_IV]EQC45825.1 ATP-grasp domain protein [Bacteriovorax sp. BSW11_IV]
MNVLLTSAGRRVSLIKQIKETLSKLNLQGEVHALDMHPELSSACHVADKSAPCPRASNPEYTKFVLDYCIEHNIKVVIPTIDTELEYLADDRDLFEEKGIHVEVSSPEICRIFRTKKSTADIFNTHKIPTPTIVEPNESSNYPLFAKLDNSSRSIGACTVLNYEHAKSLKEKSSDYVFQELVHGEEFTVDCFVSKEKKLLACVPRKRLEVRSGEVSKAKTEYHEKIEKIAHDIVANIDGFRGTFCFQIFLSDKDVSVIEINPRFGGGYPLTYNAGANFFELILLEKLGKDLPSKVEWKNNLHMLRYDEGIFF